LPDSASYAIDLLAQADRDGPLEAFSTVEAPPRVLRSGLIDAQHVFRAGSLPACRLSPRLALFPKTAMMGR